jgi:hypothetical protein
VEEALTPEQRVAAHFDADEGCCELCSGCEAVVAKMIREAAREADAKIDAVIAECNDLHEHGDRDAWEFSRGLLRILGELP